eukprot:2612058-Pyramimonas_sp.AAC.1
MDLFELIAGDRGLATGNAQRVAVMSLEEDRLTGTFRRVSLVPTTSMLADGMTKIVAFLQLSLNLESTAGGRVFTQFGGI